MDPHLERYATNLTRPAAAASYSTKYERIWHKRLSDRAERRVLRAAIAQTRPPHARVLDMPCGSGRLTSELDPAGGTIVTADFSLEQIRICRERRGVESTRAVRASCFALPFRDRTFDLVYSGRLSHHIASEHDRERYLVELFRVAESAVIATFFDEHSLKNRLRELRRVFRPGLRRKFTMNRARLAQIAAAHGFELVSALPLSRVFSGHRFFVFRRKPA